MVRNGGNTLHTQPAHDEIVVILEGEADFQVGDEVRRVGPGDLVFIPRNTLHGPILRVADKLSALSVYAPFFDRSKRNIKWDRDKQT
jgi:quercetin dioxygenase-like cupin family protein